jgi:hypothetical protein
MATQKQPRFPHPPLETGVAQYPTPLVPNYNDKKGGWSINDQGHIILVEKVSIEKGSFTPQPLDGSVTYSGRDANKWPSTLYLVAEKPTEDGEFIYRYWANDRTLSSQNLWNYGIEYSLNNPSYPVTSRTYIVPRSQYSSVSLGATDPIFGGTQVISQQKMVELPEDNPLYSRYVAVQRVYESIPGPEIDGKTIGEFGYINTKEQIVAPNTSLPAPTTSTVKLDISPVDSVKSKLVEADYASLNTLTGYQYDPDLNLVITNTKEIIEPGTSVSVENGLISSRDEPVDVWKTIRIQSRISSLPASRTEYKTASYSSPNLLTGFNNSVFNFPDGQVQYNVTPVMRAERSYQTVFKYQTSYQYGQPDAPTDTLFDPLAIHVIYTGQFFRIDIPNCLTNSGLSIRFFTGTNTPAAAYYGSIDETYTVPPSDTSASTYLSNVGQYKTISYEIDYWKANIWRKSITSVLLK